MIVPRQWMLVGAPLCALLVLGCQPRVQPKGKGASGRLEAVQANVDVGHALINQLTPDQQKALAYMHRPFDVAVPAGNLAPGADKDWLQRIQEVWPTIEFAGAPSDTSDFRVVPTVRLHANVGVISIQFFTPMQPDLARDFIALTKLGYFDGVAFGAKDGLLLLEPDRGELFEFQPVEFEVELTEAYVVALPAGPGKFSGTRFGFFAVPHVPNAEKYLPFAHVFLELGKNPGATVPHMYEMILKKGQTVRIEKTEVHEERLPLFEGEKGPLLPAMDPEGIPVFEKVRRKSKAVDADKPASP